MMRYSIIVALLVITTACGEEATVGEGNANGISSAELAANCAVVCERVMACEPGEHPNAADCESDCLGDPNSNDVCWAQFATYAQCVDGRSCSDLGSPFPGDSIACASEGAAFITCVRERGIGRGRLDSEQSVGIGPTCGGNDVYCVNNTTITQCVGGQEVVLQECDTQCVISPAGRGFACEGGSRVFTPEAVALQVDGAVTLSLSTLTGNIACGLVDDYANEPGLASEQVYIILANVGSPCPEGVYGLNSSCDTYYPGTSSARCAIYRRWDASGNLEALDALAGAVSLSNDGAGNCEYEVDLVTGGQQMNVTFSVDISGDPGGEWCGDF